MIPNNAYFHKAIKKAIAEENKSLREEVTNTKASLDKTVTSFIQQQNIIAELQQNYKNVLKENNRLKRTQAASSSQPEPKKQAQGMSQPAFDDFMKAKKEEGPGI